MGGEATLRVDVRVIATTHRDLAAMVAAGTFRLDLYQRLRVVEVVIPPLRERPEDIAPLVAHFAERAAREHGVSLRRFATHELDALRARSWLGNVRELEHEVLRATLPPAEVIAAGQTTHTVTAHAKEVSPLDDAMRAHIERALRATNGRIYGADGAAKPLGVKPTTLQSRMKKLGMQR